MEVVFKVAMHPCQIRVNSLEKLRTIRRSPSVIPEVIDGRDLALSLLGTKRSAVPQKCVPTPKHPESHPSVSPHILHAYLGRARLDQLNLFDHPPEYDCIHWDLERLMEDDLAS